MADLDALAAGDPELLFALRRRLFTRLMHLERGAPAHRTKLKAEKWQAQQSLRALCDKPMAQKGSELDRASAWKGYTPENTRPVHHQCHVADQLAKGFTDREAEIVEGLEEMEGIEAAKDEAEIKVGDEWVESASPKVLVPRQGLRCAARPATAECGLIRLGRRDNGHTSST